MIDILIQMIFIVLILFQEIIIIMDIIYIITAEIVHPIMMIIM